MANLGTTGTYYVYGTGFQTGAQVTIESSGGYTYSATDEVLSYASDRMIKCTLSIPTNAQTGYYTLFVQNYGAPSSTRKVNAFYVSATTTSSITVTVPNGGENWQKGSYHRIEWSYTGDPGTKVDIILLKGNTRFGTIESNWGIDSNPGGYTGKGFYPWTINSNLETGTDYRITIQSSINPSIKDTSNYFNLIPAAPTITVTLPNGGESWLRGTPHMVTWRYTGNPGPYVKIVLLNADEVGTIKDSWPIGSGGLGSYTWNINPTGLTGSDYKVKISSLSQPTITDTSNGYFTITSVGPLIISSITVTSPNGGETWKRGTSQPITWSYTGNPGSTVKIELLKGSQVGTIADNVPIGANGKGSYTWPISSSGYNGSDYKVNVQSILYPTVNDTSNGYFIITSATIAPSITVMSPNGGERWYKYTTHTITWTYTGNPGPTVKIMILKGSTVVDTFNNVPIGSSGKGTYSWWIKTSYPSGSDYKVLVQSTSQPTIKDTSNTNFGISWP